MLYTGFILFLVGVSLSISARFYLGHNWVTAAEYQVKKGQSLTTRGIYRFIRHPIYTGLTLATIGLELIVRSYLVLPLGLVTAWVAYYQGKKEEGLLSRHFGKRYRDYMRKTKMFIPYIF